MAKPTNAYPGCKGAIQVKDGRMLVDGDHIAIELEDIPPTPGGDKFIEIRLALAPDVSWWKMLQVFEVGRDAEGNMTEHFHSQAELQDDNKGPAVAFQYKLPAGASLPEAFELKFWKAKFLGIHTDMEHWILNPASVLGKRVTFIWLID